jgi:hypothetical protein
MLTDNHFGLSTWRKDGYSIPYRLGETNHCPGCGHQNWHVGRLMAECAFCGTALILMHVHGYGATQRICRHGSVEELPPVELRKVA